MSADVTILGSGTLIPDHRRHSAAFLIEEGQGRVLLDCGAGLLDGLSRTGAPWMEVTHVALTHFHVDHVGGLPPFLFALSHGVSPRRSAPLTILGPPGVRRLMDSLAEAHGDFVLDPGFALDVVELERNGRYSEKGVELYTCATPHCEESVAYRWVGESGAVGYTGDTGPHPPLTEFFMGVRVLIAECSNEDSSNVETHLTPSGVAVLAGGISPELVVTTHVYPPLAAEDVPDLVRKAGYDGWVLAGRDGMRVSLEDGEVLSL